jgi:hypothetical protein
MPTRFDEIRNQAAKVRQIKLVTVLQQIGAIADKNDSDKWHTHQGTLSVTGSKFFNWTKTVGGGGAIDLIMHLENIDFIKAVSWLTENCAYPAVPRSKKTRHRPRTPLTLPKKNYQRLPQVNHYLTSYRCLPAVLIQSLINEGRLYADDRANAVFLLLGKGNTVVGAEIRGTNHKPWHALAPGSRKDRGFFYIANGNSRKLVICESAIDAISYYALDPNCRALSTAGAHPNPPWLSNLINKGFKLFCGFDSDDTGNTLAEKMISLYPSIKRLRPTHHDWNDMLKDSLLKSNLNNRCNLPPTLRDNQ